VRLFPYLQYDECEPGPSYRPTGKRINYRNDFREERPLKGRSSRITPLCLPSGVSRAAFIWEYLGTRFEYEFLAGLMGIEQDEATMALRPKIGWAVRPV
jgi:hypothetical protein